MIAKKVHNIYIMSGQKIYRQDIQALRGLAVLGVLLFHTYENVFILGYLGVDVFFVISGFLVTPLVLKLYLSEDSNLNLKLNFRNFYRRRFFRLGPALAATLVISSILILLFGVPTEHQRFTRQGIATLFLIGNVGAVRYSGNYFSPNPNPLVHTWSLSVEEQFYIFLPFLLCVVLSIFKKCQISIVKVFAVISLLSFVIFLHIVNPVNSKIDNVFGGKDFSFYSPIERFWQFGLGGLIFIMGKKPKNTSIVIKYLTSIFAALLLLGQFDLSPKLGSFIASITASLMIHFQLLEGLDERLLKIFRWLGYRSYSIYLIHMPLLYLAKFSPFTSYLGLRNYIISSTIALVISLYLGHFIYRKIEIRFKLKNKEKKLSKKYQFFALMLILILPLSMLIVMDRGANSRYWGLNKNVVAPASDAWGPSSMCLQIIVEGPCYYQFNKKLYNVLLIGDSHAAMYSSAILRSLEKSRYNLGVWTKGNCSFQLSNDNKGNLTKDCLNQNLRILEWLKKNKTVLVIVSEYIRKDLAQENLQLALNELRYLVPHVILIENNPIFPDASDFMKERPIVMEPYKPPKAFNRDLMDFSDKESNNTLVGWAKHNGITTINVDEIFCSAQKCIRYFKGEWLYSDVGHLSLAGAALTVNKFRIVFNSLITS